MLSFFNGAIIPEFASPYSSIHPSLLTKHTHRGFYVRAFSLQARGKPMWPFRCSFVVLPRPMLHFHRVTPEIGYSISPLKSFGCPGNSLLGGPRYWLQPCMILLPSTREPQKFLLVNNSAFGGFLVPLSDAPLLPSLQFSHGRIQRQMPKLW